MSRTISRLEPIPHNPIQKWHSGRYLSRIFARRPAQLVAAVSFLGIAGLLALVFAAGAEANAIPVCNQATQVNTVCTGQNTLTLAPPSGWWHTNGVQIMDSAGNQVNLRGVDDGRMVQTSPGTLAASEFSNLHDWGFNFIRLGVSWANLEPNAPTSSSGTLNHTWSDSYLSAIDSVVSQASANHLRIVLDFHQVNWSPKFSGTGMPSWLFPSSTVTEGQAKCEFMTNTIESGSPESQQAGLTAAEQMIATRYMDNNTVVGIDMFNEPQSCNYGGKQTYFVPTGGTPYDDFYHNIGTALHQTNPNLLLIYEDDAYQSYLKQSFALTRPLDVPGAIYSSHMYPDSWPNGNSGATCQPATTVTGQQIYQSHLDKANAWQQPFYIGEFDGFHLGANACTALSTASQDLLTMMSAAKAGKVNWSLWEYSRAGQSLIDSSGQPKQPLLADLQTGIETQPTTGSGSNGSVTLCHTGSGTLNSWDSAALDATIPTSTAVAVKFATASGSCGSLTSQSAFSAPIDITDAGTAGGTDPHALNTLNLPSSKSLVIEVDLSATGVSDVPTVNSLTLADTPASNSPPSVPSGLSATTTMTAATVSWAASTDDTDAASSLTYQVFRGATQLVQTPAGATSYTDGGLSPATAYTYTVVACDTQSSCSAASPPLVATTKSDTSAPSVPTNLNVTFSNTSATLTWTASTDPDNTAAQLTYRVYRNSTQVGTTPAGVAKYTDTGLKARTNYSYAVSACDPIGNCSAKSATKTIKTLRR